ncbi:hypothetical protein, partial [Streptomyces mirabilis]|uniref:hypothetical protein n=1 Tax=Streptomyces mirabilis TaxID=68239 RepID=UPI00369404C8
PVTHRAPFSCQPPKSHGRDDRVYLADSLGRAIYCRLIIGHKILLENKAVFRERMFMSPLSLDASLGTVSLDYWDAICTPDCDEAYQDVHLEQRCVRYVPEVRPGYVPQLQGGCPRGGWSGRDHQTVLDFLGRGRM